jgi:hypothetical protein
VTPKVFFFFQFFEELSEMLLLTYLGLTTIFFPILTGLEFSGEILMEVLNVKFHQNLSSDSQVFPCGKKDRRRDT